MGPTLPAATQSTVLDGAGDGEGLGEGEGEGLGEGDGEGEGLGFGEDLLPATLGSVVLLPSLLFPFLPLFPSLPSILRWLDLFLSSSWM